MSMSQNYDNYQKISFAQIIIPALAKEIGLEKSIIINQLHYWLNKCPKIIKNTRWIYNTIEKWGEQFPYWSLSKIKRIFSKLEEDGFILTSKFNANNYNQTKWYTINYKKLYSIIECFDIDNHNLQRKSNGKSGHKILEHAEDIISNQLVQNDLIYNKDTYIKTNNNKKLSIKTVFANNSVLYENIEERKMIDIWNKIIGNGSQNISLTKNRAILLSLNLKQHFNNDINEWQEFCTKIASSKFLMGEITNFKIHIDWALKTDNLVKVLEGAYRVGDRNAVLKEKDLEEFIEVITEESTEEIKLLKESLLQHIGKATYISWFKKVKFDKINHNYLKLKAPTKFIGEYIEQNFMCKILNLYNKIIGINGNIEICY